MPEIPWEAVRAGPCATQLLQARGDLRSGLLHFFFFFFLQINCCCKLINSNAVAWQKPIRASKHLAVELRIFFIRMKGNLLHVAFVYLCVCVWVSVRERRHTHVRGPNGACMCLLANKWKTKIGYRVFPCLQICWNAWISFGLGKLAFLSGSVLPLPSV